MQLSEWLRREGVTRVDFAKRIGVSPSHVTGLCDGVSWPGRDVAAEILKATNGEVTPGDFLPQDAA